MKLSSTLFLTAGVFLSSSLAQGQSILRPSERFDWVGIIGTGQSLSVGAWFAQPLTTEASYNNLKLFDSSGLYKELGDSLTVTPLTEPLRTLDGVGGYPKNVLGPSHHKGMADTITRLSMKFQNRDYITAHSEVGLSGTSYSGIKKGGDQFSFDAALYETQAFGKIARNQNKRYGVGAILLTHGENDWKSPTYKEDMAQMQIDFERDIKAITGQEGTIPLFTSQEHSYPCAINLTDGVNPKDYSSQKQWHVGNDYPGKVFTVGPKYQYPYRDTIHLTAEGYDSFGQKAGEIYYRVMELGEDWKPLKPVTITRSSPRTIRVSLHVPNPPLRWDESFEAPHQTANLHWKNGKGFEVVRKDGSPIKIVSVKIVEGSSNVDIEVDEDSANADRVQYAMTMDGQIVPGTNDWGCYGGSPLGFRGQLMDSDAMINQPNYLVAFSKRVE